MFVIPVFLSLLADAFADKVSLLLLLMFVIPDVLSYRCFCYLRDWIIADQRFVTSDVASTCVSLVFGTCAEWKQMFEKINMLRDMCVVIASGPAHLSRICRICCNRLQAKPPWQWRPPPPEFCLHAGPGAPTEVRIFKQ